MFDKWKVCSAKIRQCLLVSVVGVSVDNVVQLELILGDDVDGSPGFDISTVP